MTAIKKVAEKGDVGIRYDVPLIREKQIRAVKIGQWRIKPEDLDEFIRARTNKQKRF